MQGGIARKIRVAIVNEGAAGGLRRHVVDIPKKIDKKNFSVTVILSQRPEYSSEPDPAEELRDDGIPCIHVPMVRELSLLEDFRSLRELKRLLIPDNFEVVHAHAAKAGFLARYTCRGRLPCIYTPHVFAFQRSSSVAAAFYRKAERIAVQWTKTFAVTSVQEKKLALQMGVLPENIQLIRNAVDPPKKLAPEMIEQVRASFGTHSEAIVFLTAGRLVRYKGHRDLIRAFNEVAATAANIELWIAGEGEERSALEALAAHGSKQRIRFLGHRRDLQNLMTACDCFVLTSRAEGSPYAILEALANEKPIIATLVAGTNELLHKSEHCRLVAWNDYKALAEAISQFVRHPFQGAPFVSLPKEWFDVVGQIKKIEALYESVAAL